MLRSTCHAVAAMTTNSIVRGGTKHLWERDLAEGADTACDRIKHPLLLPSSLAALLAASFLLLGLRLLLLQVNRPILLQLPLQLQRLLRGVLVNCFH